jgi:hypothetical protein
MIGEERRRPAWRRSLFALLCASSFIVHSSSRSASAAPTQEDVLRSIGQHIDQQRGDPSKLLALLAAAGGLAILLLVFSHRRKRELSHKALHHHGKLLREIRRAISLKPAELRQLKTLAEAQNVSSPLTLLLCPSLRDRPPAP